MNGNYEPFGAVAFQDLTVLPLTRQPWANILFPLLVNIHFPKCSRWLSHLGGPLIKELQKSPAPLFLGESFDHTRTDCTCILCVRLTQGSPTVSEIISFKHYNKPLRSVYYTCSPSSERSSILSSKGSSTLLPSEHGFVHIWGWDMHKPLLPFALS